MPSKIFTLALLIIVPLVWSMSNENTVLPKNLALAVLAGAALAQINPARLSNFFRGALPIHAMLGFALASAAFAPSPYLSWQAALSVLTLWIATGISTIPASGHWQSALPAAAALPIALGFAQLAGIDPSSWQNLVRDHFHGRACSSLGNPNFFAAFLAGSAPFLVLVSLAVTSRPGKLVSLSALVLAGAGLAGSGSKGGMLGFFFGLAVFSLAWIRGRHSGQPADKRRLFQGFSAFGLGILLGLALLPPDIRGRIVMTEPGVSGVETGGTIQRLAHDESVRFRLLTWGQTLRMVRDRPLFGHGLGRFQAVYPRFRLPEIIAMFGQHSYMTDHPENISLEIAADLGLAGLGLWLWLLVFVSRKLAAKLSAGSRIDRRIAAACAGGLAGLLAANSFGLDIHYGGSAVLAACLLGAALSDHRAAAERERVRLFLPAAAFGVLLSLAWIRIFASDAALARAMAASNDGRWEHALAFYRKASLFNPANVMSRYFQASALLDRGKPQDLTRAKALLDTVRRESADYVLINYKYWLLYNRLGLKAEANAALARQIELDPLAAEFYLERGRKAAEEGRFQDARDDFEKALSLEGDNPTAYQYLGNLLVMQGHFKQALAVYSDGLYRNPQSPELHYNFAVAAYNLGDAASARKHVLAALAISPEHAQARAVLEKLNR